MKQVLVTGPTGFIGQYLIQLLLKRKIKTRVLIRNQQKAALFSNHIDIFLGDLTHPTSLKNICNDIDTVFHLGGYAHAFEETSSHFAEQHRQVNLGGTHHLLQEAIKSRVKKFIYFSSVKAVADSNQCIDESYKEWPTTAYGIAKREAENLALSSIEAGLQVCILRPSLVYGPLWKGNLANMLRAIDKGVFPPLPPISDQHRSMVSVNDLCQAALLAAEKAQSNGKTYIVTDGITYSSYELYRMMREALGKKPLRWHIPFWTFQSLAIVGDLSETLIRKRLPFNSETLCKLFSSAQYSSKLIESDLDFQPIYNFKTMLPTIIEHYRKTT